MASFEEHISQAKRNLVFLENVNHTHSIEQSDDWQVTIIFYSAVHLINAHLARSCNLHYNSHKKVENAINCFNATSPARLPEDVYLAYKSLRNLSRRSRYLCKDADFPLEEARAYLTYEKHVAKAIRHLDVLMWFISNMYSVNFDVVNIVSLDLASTHSLNYFKCFNVSPPRVMEDS